MTAGRIVNDDTDVDEDDEMTLSELEDAEANLAERERNRIERERLARMVRRLVTCTSSRYEVFDSSCQIRADSTEATDVQAR